MSDSIEPRRVVGIVGMGTMGRGIARAFLPFPYRLVLIDENVDIGERALSILKQEIVRKVSKGALKMESLEAAFSRITLARELSEFEEADLVIESVNEIPETKKGVYERMESCVTSECLIVTNTSSLSVHDLSDHVQQKNRFAGMHFFNPADVLPLVEVSRSQHTSNQTMSRVHDYAKAIGKVPLEVPDIPGFYVNRILFPMIIEAIRVLQSTPGSRPESIDEAMKKGANLPIGPLELSDLIGNDIVLNICETLFIRTGSPSFEVPELLRTVVAENKLGRKTRSGFRDY